MLTLVVIVLLSTDPEGDYLKIRLTAADALVLEKTITQEFLLYAAENRFATQPTSLQLLVNGQEFQAPKTFVSWESYDLNVSAPRQKLRPRERAWVLSS